MIILFTNNFPGSGKSTACLCLANALYDLPGNDEVEMVVFDCDPSFPSLIKYKEATKHYKDPLFNYQMNSLDLSNEEMVNKTLLSILKKDGYYLFDITGGTKVESYLRILFSSDIILIPIQPSKKEDPKFLDFLTYVLNLHFIIQTKTKGTGLRIMLVPIHLDKKDADIKINLNSALPVKILSPILFHEKLSDNIIPLKPDNESYTSYQDYLKDTIPYIQQISKQLQQQNKEQTYSEN